MARDEKTFCEDRKNDEKRELIGTNGKDDYRDIWLNADNRN